MESKHSNGPMSSLFIYLFLNKEQISKLENRKIFQDDKKRKFFVQKKRRYKEKKNIDLYPEKLTFFLTKRKISEIQLRTVSSVGLFPLRVIKKARVICPACSPKLCWTKDASIGFKTAKNMRSSWEAFFGKKRTIILEWPEIFSDFQ